MMGRWFLLLLSLGIFYGSLHASIGDADPCRPKLRNKHLSGVHGDKICNNVSAVHDMDSVGRYLLEEAARNVPAYPMSTIPLRAVLVPSCGSGSFAAIIPNSSGLFGSRRLPHPDDSSSLSVKHAAASRSNWIYSVIIPASSLILITTIILILAYQRNAAAIDPWRTGLSGPLRNAFITGVPKLNPLELETACEDFSNIIITYPNCTIYKGTLSGGVEVAVVSTNATSHFDWSERSEAQFRNKVDVISKINHKNFVNLLGYCQEDDPFMRMMVFEYAPNGTLFEHLHVKEFEHLDWSTRMRIVMGIANCLQHMHELKPAVVHPILHSSCVFITDDYAAKIADMGIFSEPVGKEKRFTAENKDSFAGPTSCPESNVYSFGILVLEIISGRMAICEEDGLPILDWAMEQLRKSAKCLVDPSLKSSREEELQCVCRVAEACIAEDPKRRPTMKEVAASLKEALRISPEAAAPRLSPLWWAELEILSVEAG